MAAASAAGAQPPSASASAAPESGDIRAWLMRINDAAGHRNFQGTFVVSAGGRMSSSHIAHFCEGPHQFERIDALDGQKRQVFRHDDLVQTSWPDKHVATVEQRDSLTSFPALLQAGHGRITEHYELSSIGTDRVAGLEADVLQIKPRDALRYGYRLWAEKSSGLLLRSEVLDARDQVLESSAFSEVTIGVKPQPDSVLLPMRQTKGWQVVDDRSQATKLEKEGWVLAQVVPGFHHVSCVRRQLPGPHEAESGMRVPVLQSVYSDGLTYVSIFIEPYNPQRHAQPVETVIGATQTLMRRQGDWWITVVGDVPVGTLRQFTAALERRK